MFKKNKAQIPIQLLYSPIKILNQVKFYLFLIFCTFGIKVAIPFFIEDAKIILNSDRALIILLALFITAALLRVIQYLGDGMMSGRGLVSLNMSQSAQSFVIKLIKGFTVLLAALTVLDSFGITITPILASLGIGSLAIALALQDTLGNLFSGIYLIIDQPFVVGDYVKVEDANVEGIIEKIGWRSTRIIMFQSNTITIPNSKLSSSVLINYFNPSTEAMLIVPCGVAYDSDLDLVEKITIEAAYRVIKTHPAAAKGADPLFRFHTFNSSSIDFNIIIKVANYTDRFVLTHALIKEIKAAFDKNSIEIPFPQRVLTHKNNPLAII